MREHIEVNRSEATVRRARPLATWSSGDLPPTTVRQMARKAIVCRAAWPFLSALAWCALRLVGKYRIQNLADIRRRYAEIAAVPGPLLICSNHLTFIDSILILWALGSPSWHWRHFTRSSWNVPAADVFGRSRFWRAIFAMTKCVMIDRTGSLRHRDDVLRVCSHLLLMGETVTIFPEGRRSRSGHFDLERLKPGLGKVVAATGPCRVLCIYLRGDRQPAFSDFPPRGSTFKLGMDIIDLDQEVSDLPYRAITRIVGQRIAHLEESYLTEHASMEANANASG